MGEAVGEDDGEALVVLRTLAELERLILPVPEVHVRYSEGYDADSRSGSIDTESGLELPGLSVNPLTPESWWSRPLPDWQARQLCQYKHLQKHNPQRHAWVLQGHNVGRGPDCEPLLADVVPMARIADEVLGEAEHLYHERFDAGSGPEG